MKSPKSLFEPSRAFLCCVVSCCDAAAEEEEATDDDDEEEKKEERKKLFLFPPFIRSKSTFYRKETEKSSLNLIERRLNN